MSRMGRGPPATSLRAMMIIRTTKRTGSPDSHSCGSDLLEWEIGSEGDLVGLRVVGARSDSRLGRGHGRCISGGRFGLSPSAAEELNVAGDDLADAALLAFLVLKGPILQPPLLSSRLGKRTNQRFARDWVRATMQQLVCTGGNSCMSSTNEAPKSPTLVVSADGSERYRRIGDAVADAEPMTRIVVRPGRYSEQLILEKPVEIRTGQCLSNHSLCASRHVTHRRATAIQRLQCT
ncbi:MAG: hypothetical protein QOJ59_1066 [Thermomicrobiales bacterium]|nr:hypothetical protein [Thermomicrobiales bacterium]